MSTLNIQLEGKTIELPIIEGSEGEKAIDISKLRTNSGYITIDPGYKNTGACLSGVTFLNGESGVLRYRGYPIEQLAESADFLEVSSLLLKGELPNKEELKNFDKEVKESSTLHEVVKNIIKSFPKDAHPMAVLSASMTSLSSIYPHLTNSNLSEDQINKVIPVIMGQIKVIAASYYRNSLGKEVIASNSELNFASDFLNMMFGEVDPEVADALDTLLILHADHEQNCSATAVRIVGSAQTNLFATIASGVNALWGPLHGGANQKVIEMLDAIQKDGGDYKKYLDKAKDKSDPFRLMGFGHRVYKNFDPRAKIIKKACDTILEKLGVQDPVLDIAKGLEAQALKDPYFVDRKLYPNVDFYSGIIYRALGIPTNMFTVMFALGRAPGWMAQWKELITDAKSPISRPRQIYTGANERDYKSLS